MKAALLLYLLLFPPALHSQQVDAPLRSAILAAEDARTMTPQVPTPVRTGLVIPGTVAQRLAVRALGRLEQPGLARDIAPLLAVPVASVRAEAANSLEAGRRIPMRACAKRRCAPVGAPRLRLCPPPAASP